MRKISTGMVVRVMADAADAVDAVMVCEGAMLRPSAAFDGRSMDICVGTVRAAIILEESFHWTGARAASSYTICLGGGHDGGRDGFSKPITRRRPIVKPWQCGRRVAGSGFSLSDARWTGLDPAPLWPVDSAPAANWVQSHPDPPPRAQTDRKT
ncbi:hypothetical protein ACCO45_013204 [Purpureocillium lilacinum]|uniref:Uncharacterized protein n=1 Tax=Purpureocillium lilacinum TaxID=33203 RepID=A0ACC4DCR1_PURLI